MELRYRKPHTRLRERKTKARNCAWGTSRPRGPKKNKTEPRFFARDLNPCIVSQREESATEDITTYYPACQERNYQKFWLNTKKI
jgi:hypothetical protein